MKSYRLLIHKTSTPTSSAEEEVVVNPDDFSVGQVLEIFHPDDENSHFIVQVSAAKTETKVGQIGVSQKIASVFRLKHQRDINVQCADLKEVTLELIELEMKDQYIDRSDMLRVKQNLQEKCVYSTKKVEFSGIRVRVVSLWTKQQSVMSGYVGCDTKIVFRSSSCIFYIFVQMSCEMWEFDPYGDLYFERAVGFLQELFERWKVQECSHEVTLILFSRTFYGGALPDDFCPSVRDAIQVNSTGQCYQDFYKVVALSKTFTDFSPLLINLKRCFSHYLTWVDCCQNSDDATVSSPKGRLSVASNGNVLEALNLALNSFDHQHLDQQFDKAGQEVVLVTPGVGLFEVSRPLTNISKKRTLDSGLGIDLVCLSAQPLHAAPLLMFNDGQTDSKDFHIPDWINCSFHTSEAQATRNRQGKFIPQISMPDFGKTFALKSKRPCALDLSSTDFEEPKTVRTSSFTEEDKLQRVDYDAYDALVFNVHARAQRRVSRLHSSNVDTARRNLDTLDLVGLSSGKYRSILATSTPAGAVNDEQLPRQNSFDLRMETNATQHSRTNRLVGELELAKGSLRESSASFEGVQSPHVFKHHVVGFRGSRPLVNPFAPSQQSLLFVTHHSRWSHTFRHDVTGQCIQDHHMVQEEPHQVVKDEERDVHIPLEKDVQMNPAVLSAAKEAVAARLKEQANLELVDIDELENATASDSSSTEVTYKNASQGSDPGQSLWQFFTPPTSPTKYQRPFIGHSVVRDVAVIPASKWTLELIGMDWKSIEIPACLPLTTDFFPNNLKNEYYEHHYALFADDSGAISDKQALSCEEIYHEVISQRLCKGYQMIILNSAEKCQMQTASRSLFRSPAQQEMYLTTGKSHHLVKINNSQVEVTIFKPKHQQSNHTVQYQYKLWEHCDNNYQVTSATFHKGMTDDFNWNYLDHYVCGNSDFKELVESLKYSKSRYLLLPVVMDMKVDFQDFQEVMNGRIRKLVQFLETLHKLRRPLSLGQSKGHPRHLSVPTDAQLTAQERRLKKAASIGEGTSTVAKPNRHHSLKPQESVVEECVLSNDNGDNKDDIDSSQDIRLQENSRLEEIVSAMKDPMSGVEVLSSASGRLKDCFLGFDVVTWLMCNVSGLDTREKAIGLAQKMVQNRFLIHASGDSSCGIVDGFYLFQFGKQCSNDDVIDATYKERWMEVSMERLQVASHGLGQAVFRHPLMSTPTPSTPPTPQGIFSTSTISLSLKANECDSGPRKIVKVNVDPQGRSDRPEWCSVCYDSTYSPAHAFCLEFQWLMATTSLVNDMIASWARRASQNGFHLVPAPSHPMSRPHLTRGNPFRMPVFLPLELMSPSVNWYLRKGGFARHQLFLLQEMILARFNFLVDRPAGTKAQVSESTLSGAYSTTYVHESGSVFVQIANPNPSRESSRSRSGSPGKGARPSLDLSLAKVISFEKPGFHWSPNHLIFKRWRSPAAGEVEIADKLWQDMSCFCQNRDSSLDLFLVQVGCIDSTE